MELGFVRGDDARLPFDAARRLAAIPTTARSRGIMFVPLMRSLKRAGVEDLGGYGPYQLFGSYPTRELMALSLEAGARFWPEQTARARLIRLGRHGFPTLLDSLMGRSLFQSLDGDLVEILKLVNVAYQALHSPISARLVERAANKARIRFEEAHHFWDTIEVGNALGVMQRCGITSGQVWLRYEGPSQGELMLTW